MMFAGLFTSLLLIIGCYQKTWAFSSSTSYGSVTSSNRNRVKPSTSSTMVFLNRTTRNKVRSILKQQVDRTEFIQTAGILGVFAFIINPVAVVAASTGKKNGNLPDLPPDAVRSYLQYRIPLQISVDYYLFELQDKMRNVEEWGEVGQLFVISAARGGQGQPNRMERDFFNPMRILELSMPPDDADQLQMARDKFERAMQIINKATSGIRRDSPVEVSEKDIEMAIQGWEDGRVALNEFLLALNTATGLPHELKTIPSGDNMNQVAAQYGRSRRKFYDLMKKTNGNPDLEDYFFQ